MGLTKWAILLCCGSHEWPCKAYSWLGPKWSLSTNPLRSLLSSFSRKTNSSYNNLVMHLKLVPHWQPTTLYRSKYLRVTNASHDDGQAPQMLKGEIALPSSQTPNLWTQLSHNLHKPHKERGEKIKNGT